ncbi:hypothetical protein MKK63_15775 [Methylobacterium sp. J-088]|uniref:hypothetical protein n=1 Tax=Methylobacterium sp. J-088 TaxID=2836664 RepID=UPI001FBAE807|nr:hypothetical protein [Methylobacterium sp. J-088]MCJ2064161.1 hypothetical protein [Methylobacterium sp. J-088]
MAVDMTIPDLLHIIWEFAKGDYGGRVEASVAAAIAGLLLSTHFKKKRLRAAIRQEIEIVSASYADKLTQQNKDELINLVKSDPDYRVLILTSMKRSIISNLDDDISYLPQRVAKHLIHFNDLSELIDDTITVLRSETFSSLSLARKIATLEVPFRIQPERQDHARRLLEDL